MKKKGRYVGDDEIPRRGRLGANYGTGGNASTCFWAATKKN